MIKLETASFNKCPAAARRQILAAIEKLDIRELKIARTIIPVYTEPNPCPSHYYTGEVTYTVRGWDGPARKTRKTP